MVNYLVDQVLVRIGVSSYQLDRFGHVSHVAKKHSGTRKTARHLNSRGRFVTLMILGRLLFFAVVVAAALTTFLSTGQNKRCSGPLQMNCILSQAWWVRKGFPCVTPLHAAESQFTLPRRLPLRHSKNSRAEVARRGIAIGPKSGV
jgi:hypothetical protein